MSLDIVIERAISEAKSTEIERHGPVTVAQMLDVVRATAHEIEGAERINLLVGRSFEPDGLQMYRVAVLDALGNFLDACQSRPGDVARRLEQKRRVV
jgi:hypothetical protein